MAASPQLSTREVIEQARAAARAAAAAPKPQDPARRRSGARAPCAPAACSGALKPARPPSTWQTALMVAGGAAFLSVGAAGVVLMEGPGGAHARAAAVRRQPARRRGAGPGAGRASTIAGRREPIDPGRPAAAAPAAPPARSADADYVKTAAAVRAEAARRAGPTEDHRRRRPARRRRCSWPTSTRPVRPASCRTSARPAAGRCAPPKPAIRPPCTIWRSTISAARAARPDTAAAAQWFKKAAEHGVVDSQYNLGLLYQSGSGVPRDLALRPTSGSPSPPTPATARPAPAPWTWRASCPPPSWPRPRPRPTPSSPPAPRRPPQTAGLRPLGGRGAEDPRPARLLQGPPGRRQLARPEACGHRLSARSRPGGHRHARSRHRFPARRLQPLSRVRAPPARGAEPWTSTCPSPRCR